jgi:pilus assembly protein CpaC
MKRIFLKKFFIITLGFVLLAFYMPKLSADQDTSDSSDSVVMVVGDIKIVQANKLTRVSLNNPEVADISDAQNNKVTVLAKKSGETVLFLWDGNGERTIKIRVINEDLDIVKARVQKVLDEAGISGVSLVENLDIGKVVVSGSLPKDDKARLLDILEPYNDNLLDLITEEKNEDLIQVDMQIVEISTSLEKNLGILWGTSTNSSTGATSSSSTSATGTSGSQVQLNYNETLPSSNGSIADFFKIGKFYRTTPLEATVNALVQEGKARLISKPRLVVVSGKQASFLVGGEIPIESTTTNTTGSTLTQNTTYTQYGVNMMVTPTIRDGKIEVLLNVDIRDIDPSNSSNGNVAFITRTAQTNLFMDNNQTIALAGLIKYEDSEQITEVPFLSKIPILGALFRNRATPSPDSNTEMVIILTPTVLTDKKFADREVVMPTPAERSADREIEAKYEQEPVPSWSATKTGAMDSGASSTVLPVMMSYARMVEEKISKAIFYPQTTMGDAMSGTVKLKLHILKDGSLDSEEVMESSGNAMLDQYALQAAKAASPYDAFTTGMDQEDLIFTIPIVYNKLISEGNETTGKAVVSY